MFENVKFGPFNVLTWYRHRRQVTRVNRIMTVMYFMNVISFSFSFPTCTRDQEQLLNRIFCLHNTNNKRNYTADASPLDQTQGFSYLHKHTYMHTIVSFAFFSALSSRNFTYARFRIWNEWSRRIFLFWERKYLSCLSNMTRKTLCIETHHIEIKEKKENKK